MLSRLRDPLDIPCSSPEQARNVAVGHCIRNKGNSCEANEDSLCENCPKRDEGLQRRASRQRKEKEETIREVVLKGAGIFGHEKRMRLRRSGSYYVLEVGKRYSDDRERFSVNRSITLCPDEVSKAIQLLQQFNP